MSQNLFKVTSGIQLNKFINNFPYSLFIVLINSNKSKQFINAKNLLKDLSTSYKNIYFVSVNNNNYSHDNVNYFSQVKTSPSFVFIISHTVLNIISGVNRIKIIESIKEITPKIEQALNKLNTNENDNKEDNKEDNNIKDNNNEDNNINSNNINNENNLEIEKDNTSENNLEFDNENQYLMNNIRNIIMYGKLCALTDLGYTLTKKYELDHNLDDMITEYNYQIKNKMHSDKTVNETELDNEFEQLYKTREELKDVVYQKLTELNNIKMNRNK